MFGFTKEASNKREKVTNRSVSKRTCTKVQYKVYWFITSETHHHAMRDVWRLDLEALFRAHPCQTHALAILDPKGASKQPTSRNPPISGSLSRLPARISRGCGSSEEGLTRHLMGFSFWGGGAKSGCRRTAGWYLLSSSMSLQYQNCHMLNYILVSNIQMKKCHVRYWITQQQTN